MNLLAHGGALCPADILQIAQGLGGLAFALCWVRMWWHHRTHHKECSRGTK